MISHNEITSLNIKIKLKTLNGDTFDISIETNKKVSDLKQTIENKLKILQKKQRLIFQGRVLNDENKLIDYKIEDGHVIHLVEQNLQTNNRTYNISYPTTSSDNNLININPNPERIERYSNLFNMLLNSNLNQNLRSTNTTINSGYNFSNLNPFQSLFSNTLANSIINNLNQNSNQYSMFQIPESFKNLERPASFNKTESIEVIKQSINCIKELTKNTQNLDNFQSAYKTTKKLFNITNTYTRMHIKYKIGQWVDVKDSLDQWSEAQIIDIKENENLALIKFLPQSAYTDSRNEWISMSSERITLYRTFTLQSPFSKYNSPFPNSKSESELVMLDVGNFDKFDNLDDLVIFLDNLREKIIQIIQTKEALFSKKSRFYENRIKEEEIVSRQKILYMLVMQVYPIMDRVGRLFIDFSNYLYHYSFEKFKENFDMYKTNFSSSLYDQKNILENTEEILNHKINMFKELTVIPVMRNSGEVAESYNLTRPRMGIIVADVNALAQNVNTYQSINNISNLTQSIHNNSNHLRHLPRSLKFENLQISKNIENLSIFKDSKKKKIFLENFISNVNSFYFLSNEKFIKNDSRDVNYSSHKDSENKNLPDQNYSSNTHQKNNCNSISCNKSQIILRDKIIIEAKEKNIKLPSQEYINGNKILTKSYQNSDKNVMDQMFCNKTNQIYKTSNILSKPTNKINFSNEFRNKNKVYKIKPK